VSAVGKPIHKQKIDLYDPFSLYVSDLYGSPSPSRQSSVSKQTIIYGTSQPGPDAVREKFDELTSFGVWGTLGSGVRVGAVMLVLRTIPGLVGRSMQNLVEIGPAVRA